MKKQKRTLSLLLAVVMVLTMCIPVFAANITDTGAATVEHSVEATWTATIPAYVIPEEQGQQTAAYSVTLENAVIPDGQLLTASVTYSGSMEESNGVELPYKLYDESGNEIQSGARIMSKVSGTPAESVAVAFGAALTAKAKYAGVYTDTATFTFDVAEKTYTAEEIAADPLLYGIGKTKSEYVIAKFNEDYSEVTIFKNGENSDGIMRNFVGTRLASPMHANNLTLKNAVVKPGVVNLGDYAFYNCSLLTDVSISDSLTSIGDHTFNGCSSLTSIMIPNTVTSIGRLAFRNCSSLISVSLPDSAESIGDTAFRGCSSLISVTIPNGVTSIGAYTFCDCISLTRVILPDSITEIGDYSFWNCKQLNDINIPENVEKIGDWAFRLCSALTNIKIPDGVVAIESYTFAFCSSLTSISIPDSVTCIGEMAFASCSSLFSISIPESVTAISSTSFNNCTTTLTIQGMPGSCAETFAANYGYTFVAQ